MSGSSNNLMASIGVSQRMRHLPLLRMRVLGSESIYLHGFCARRKAARNPSSRSLLHKSQLHMLFLGYFTALINISLLLI